MKIENGTRKYDDGELTLSFPLPPNWNPDAIEKAVRDEMMGRAEREAQENLAARRRGEAGKHGRAEDIVKKPVTPQGVIASWAPIETEEARNPADTIEEWGAKWMAARVENAAARVVWSEAKAREAVRELVLAICLLKMAKRGAVGFPENADWEYAKAECADTLRAEIQDATLAAIAQLRAEMASNTERMANTERAALRAEAAAMGKAKVDALDADLVATFRDYDTAQKGEEGTQEEIAAGVLADAREEGRLLGSMGPRAFLNAWRQWVKWKRPEAEAYGAKKRPRRRG